MKNICIVLFSLISQLLFAHGSDGAQHSLRHWSVSTENKTIDAYFLMFKEGNVFLEKSDQEVVHFPLASFSVEDRLFVQQKYDQIERSNKQFPAVPKRQSIENQSVSDSKLWVFAVFLLLLARLFYVVESRQKRKYLGVAMSLLLLTGLYSFKSDIAAKLLSTDPAFIDSAFAPFKPAVNTFWDDNYFYVESKGIPDHQMMVGITKWQQQVPIPQCYIGNNAWPIPLNPVIAATPVPVNPQHFIRGAVAIAANGVPIFNPFTNTGVDAFLDGQLDNFGGHSGRADDYHYHIAPLFLDTQTVDILPIAFALDGFAVYATHEPDGSLMTALDANHGHYGTDGVYHYHGTPTAPYMIGNMVGQVTEDNTMQIVPQAAASPVRPAQTPLQGATITDFQPNGPNGYILTYTKAGETNKVEYSWNNAGVYTFHFIPQTGVQIQIMYNGFVQCQVPVAVNDNLGLENNLIVYPNPSSGAISLKLDGPINPSNIQGISIYNLKGELLYQTKTYNQNLTINNLTKGIYLVKIQFHGQELTQKVLIQ